MALPTDQSFGFKAESALRESRQHPRDEKDPGIAPSPAPTTAVGLWHNRQCRGVGGTQPMTWDWLLLCSWSPCLAMPFSMAGVMHVGKAGPGIKIKPAAELAAWAVCAAELAGLRGIRRGEAIWAFGRMGRELLNKEIFLKYIFNTRKSRPSANMELLGAGANTICPLQGWLPSGTPRQGAGEGLLDPPK